MQKAFIYALFGASLTLACGAGALAMDPVTAGDLRIENPWTRATPPQARVGGGYLTIVNTGSEPDRLLGGTAEIAEAVEVHEMKMEGGVMKMRPLTEGLEIPAGATVKLEPGGFHLMLAKLGGAIVEGESVPVTLRFERAGTVELEFAVAPLGAREMPGHGGHSTH